MSDQVLMFLLLPVFYYSMPCQKENTSNNKTIAKRPIIGTCHWTALETRCLGRVFFGNISVEIYINISLYFMLIHSCNFIA